MKILHTADLHLGQIIYQNYERTDEHMHYFAQLERLCREEQPDALIVSGDVFDIQQPSAATWKAFTDHFVRLHRTCMAPANFASLDGWQEQFVIRLTNGYIIALPYMTGERTLMTQTLLDYVAADNTGNKPVVMTGHLTVTGCDLTGHDMDIGNIRTQAADSLGKGYDYMALGHIHKPQTIGHEADCMETEVTYPAPVIRYAGSALHVSCDETYPHTISAVDIDRHGGNVRIRQFRIDELRHFHVLPSCHASFTHAEDALNGIRRFAEENGRGYIRLQVDQATALPSDFTQTVYSIIEPYQGEVRYNPKILWTGTQENDTDETVKPKFEVAEIQQMTDPLVFIEKTRQQYPELDMNEVREAFTEIEAEMKRMAEEENASRKRTAKNSFSVKELRS